MNIKVRSIPIVILIVIAFTVRWVYRYQSARKPEYIASCVASALAEHDVDALLDMTLPEERKKLNLTRNNVRMLLNETLYASRDSQPAGYYVKLVQQFPVDQCGFDLTPKRASESTSKKLFIVITEEPDGTWHLPLGYVLGVIASEHIQKSAVNGDEPAYKQECLRLGILGSRLNSYGYAFYKRP